MNRVSVSLSMSQASTEKYKANNSDSAEVKYSLTSIPCLKKYFLLLDRRQSLTKATSVKGLKSEVKLPLLLRTLPIYY